ncbi:hypothetical protein TRICI_001406 [Trichomonascus ciferrii]|uniref:Cwf19-like C-terminal domain-containing protein n=1 Tax=Trichomonascus ciferrii TaxID=44093 RepID=A0A642VCM2_9ASCO|nr:hypothetical protein TRICI_001406 [Trichomonascus ciferrii]
MANLKVLVFGSIEGGLCKALEKANTIHKGKNGPFSMLLLLGDVFEKASDDDIEHVVGGRFTVEVPTYFFYRPGTTPDRISDILEDGYGEICGNLTCLGASGRFETTEGLKIGYDFVRQNNQPLKGDNVDILVTGDWPKGIEGETDADFKSVEKSDTVRQSVLQVRPNYHFVTRSEIFWERQPFRCSEEDTSITRFICLSQFGGPKKWFYAFNISTDKKQAPAVPVGTTSNPLETAQAQQSVIWDKGVKRGYVGDTNGPPNSKRRQQQVVRPDTCFFCLSNPNVDRDLIVSIAEESYLALAKGPMKVMNKIPHHLIFIPLAHVPTPYHLDAEPSNAVALEKQKYMVALNSMYDELDMTCISFEISRNRGVHFHTQIIAVPKDKLDAIESAFMTQAEQFGFPIMKRPLGKDENEYFKVDLPNSEPLVVELNNTFRFDLQFGRKVLANALDIPEQVDWKSCSQSNREEQSDSQKFKQAFRKFDFTI